MQAPTQRADAFEEPRLEDKDADLIRRTYKDNEQLLKLTRALFLGMETSPEEKALLKETYASEELRNLFRRRFIPYLDRNAPIGQLSDVWLGVESMVFGQPKEVGFQAVQYKHVAIQMTEMALNLLADPYAPAPNVAFNPSSYPNDELNINLLARNMYLRHVEMQLRFLWVVAQQKVTTEKEKKAAIHKDSAE